MNNYIKLSRKLLDWQWFKDANTLQLWIYCLLRANWKEGKLGDQVIRRGEFVTSYQTMANDTGLTVQQVRTAMKHLKACGCLTSKSTSKQQTVSVEKYGVFQDGDSKTNKQINNNRRIYKNKECTNKVINNKPILFTENEYEISEEDKKWIEKQL